MHAFHRSRKPLLLALACACALAHALPATPTIALEPGSDSGTPADNITNVRRPWLGGTAPAGSTVRLNDGGGLLGTATPDGGGAWRFQPPGDLNEGPHSITAEAIVPPAAPIITTVVDDVPPVIGPLPSGGVTNDNTPTLHGTAEPGSTVSIYDNGVLMGFTSMAGGTWSFTPSLALLDGPHNFTATATDSAGDTGPASSAYAITVDTVAPPAPSAVEIRSSLTGDPVPDGGTTANATPSVSGVGELSTTILLYRDGIAVAAAVVNGVGVWSTILPSFPKGTYIVTATATNAAGNTSPPSPPYTITIDPASPNKAAPLQPQARAATQLVPPAQPARTVQAPAAAAAPAFAAPKAASLPATLALTIDTTPPATPAAPQRGPGPGPAQPQISGTTEANSTVAVLDGGAPLGTALADGTGFWTFTPAAPLAAGPHSITVRATDTAGNTSGASPALALAIAGPAGAPQAIPTLSEWGVLLLSLLAAALGMGALRGRLRP